MIKQPLHPSWKTVPVNRGFQPHPRSDRSVAYIIGTGVNGKRYCCTVEVSDVNSQFAKQRLAEEFERVKSLGPSYCKEFEPEGDLPSQAEMPERRKG